MHLSKIILSSLLLCTTASCAEKSFSSASTTITTTLSNASGDHQPNTTSPIHQHQDDKEKDIDPYQSSLDAISEEWSQICRLGCQPGTFPSDTYYLTRYLLPHLINIQYKPTCNARSTHLKYFQEIIQCSGRHDLCAEKLDKGTMKCRDKALRKVTTNLKHLGEAGMDCEREGEWQGDFYGSVLDGMRWFRRQVCAPGLGEMMTMVMGKKGGVGEMRDCRLMGTCMSPVGEL
ncbi:hypothetical protein TMatcc_010104 [Talaromyces marneffei ATCC 18224]|uniref:Uncharacterized protein n=1 Tax=Talaromyces marneffei PM1 TaxID=1077442 RepID=A0A093UQA4_TALMA|nr:uncharacterized protein EYB26_009305 [Talaromyces marneffei]KAE8548249.1 hypothetical protein EYB25_010043 [Talaromyces marneffei]QGA21594.1 hypothetical protein EYB26_009305 [Talaromyces marneffei]